MSVRTEQYTLGGEKEYQIVAPETRELCSRDGSELRRAWRMVGEGEGTELLGSDRAGSKTWSTC